MYQELKVGIVSIQSQRSQIFKVAKNPDASAQILNDPEEFLLPRSKFAKPGSPNVASAASFVAA